MVRVEAAGTKSRAWNTFSHCMHLFITPFVDGLISVFTEQRHVMVTVRKTLFVLFFVSVSPLPFVGLKGASVFKLDHN